MNLTVIYGVGMVNQVLWIPGSQFLFNNYFTPNAPFDLVSALVKNGQMIDVVPVRNE